MTLTGQSGDQARLRPELARRSARARVLQGNSFPAPFRGGAFIGEHGSWNRPERNGYKVVFIRFEDGKPVGQPMDFVTDFLKGDGARGRPVGVAVDKTGASIVADDVGNTVWRVTAAGASS